MSAAGDALARIALEVDCGFMAEDRVAALAAVDYGRVLLIRFGGSRERCAAGAVAVRIAAVEATGDYVRDVSLLSTDPVCVQAEQERADRVALEERSADEHEWEMYSGGTP